jgi:hypothetical protein
MREKDGDEIPLASVFVKVALALRPLSRQSRAPDAFGQSLTH